jgi:hypothetical protein
MACAVERPIMDIERLKLLKINHILPDGSHMKHRSIIGENFIQNNKLDITRKELEVYRWYYCRDAECNGAVKSSKF